MHGRAQHGPAGGVTAIAAKAVTSAPRLILIIAAAAVAVGAVFAVGAPGALSPAGYEVSSSESTRTAATLAANFDAGSPNVVVLLTSSTADVDSDQVTAAATASELALASIPDVTDVASYWSTADPSLSSGSRQQGLIVARITADEDTTYDRVRDIRAEMDLAVQAHRDAGISVAVGGSAAANLEVVEVSERDLIRAELLVFPVTTLVLLIVFRSVVAALLPLIVSIIAVVGTAVALRALSGVTLVSIFGLNLTTALGLGMAVDYSLFIISRWREERPAAATAQQAVIVSLHTAGRSVLFSGLTTAATLAALFVFDYPLLRSLALAGFIVVILATVGALVALPAAMYLLGDRIDAGRLRAPRPHTPVTEGRWYRLAMWTMRRPILVIVSTVGLLVFIGTPFLRAEFGLPDDRVLPANEASREVADAIREDFPNISLGSVAVLWDADSPLSNDDISQVAQQLSEVDGVAAVEGQSGRWTGGIRVGDTPSPQRYVPIDGSVGADTRTWFAVRPASDAISPASADVVRSIRTLPIAGTLSVTGEPARLVDNTTEIISKIPVVLGWIALVIFVLLFVSFRSIIVPLKAFLLNLISLSASFGALVWVFQDGRFSDLLGYTPTGLTDLQTPILMFCIAFGLSMDYEVFLLSRVREEWDTSGDSAHAVAAGLQRTGGLITAAALLMAIVFLSFATGDVTVIQMVGIGLALAILVDAFIVRTLLVPAFMALAGDWNWWTPTRRSDHSPPAGTTVLVAKGTT